MKLRFTDHLKKRLKEREIPLKIVADIFQNVQVRCFDNLRNHHIVVSTVIYKGKSRKMLAAYDRISIENEVITIHPITDKQIKQRVDSGRWNYEKDKN